MAQQLENHNSEQLATDTPLTKALGGHIGVSRAAHAILFFNTYNGLTWPDGKNSSMQLYGADRDKYNIENWLMTEKRFLGLEIESIDNTLRANIEMQMNALIDVNPGVAFIYMQGHGLSEHMGSYVTGDSFVAGKEPITIKSEEWMFMLSKFDRHTQFIAITDFCHSGNFFRLRYKLEPNQAGEGARWIETDEWTQGSGAGPNRLSSPMLHLAGSTREENVFETERTGGYFTHVMSGIGAKTFLELLKSLRAGVDKHLEKAKCYDKSPIPADTTQTPQIYSSSKLSLDDPDILTKIYTRQSPVVLEG